LATTFFVSRVNRTSQAGISTEPMTAAGWIESLTANARKTRNAFMVEVLAREAERLELRERFAAMPRSGIGGHGER
jgi:hypothetical protein